MITHQLNSLKMFNSVIAELKLETLIVSSIPEFESSFTNFNTLVTGINKISTEQSLELSGIKDNKQSLKNSLAASAAKVAAGVCTYAHKNKMYDLENETNITIKSIYKLNDIDIQLKANTIISIATLHTADIVSFGIVAADITNLKADLKSFSEHYDDPTIAIANRRFDTEKLIPLFAEANEILHKEIDKFMLIISFVNSDFYKKFKIAREIWDRHGKTREMLIAEGVGIISVSTNAAFDASTLEDVKVDLLIDGVLVDTTYTDENGLTFFESVHTGKCIIRASQETFETKQSEEIIVQPGDEFNIELALDASPV
jgi:glycosyltransferase involved in cell wall biosynthesis